MSQPQTVSAILVALAAYREAAVELGRLEAVATPEPRIQAAEVKLKRAEINLLRATLAYGRRCTEPVEDPKFLEGWNIPQMPK